MTTAMAKNVPASDHSIVQWLFLHKYASEAEKTERLDQLEVLSKDEAIQYAERGGVPSDR